ncbi:MAG: polysaccharide deacetylase family protein [Planctomycetes bacterium]|nr:polysaccharide deacetylase family protein [Planctomycetota bacterium]
MDRVKDLLKKALRRALSLMNGAGLGLLLRRLGRARGAGIVLAHCIGYAPETAHLPADMKTSARKVERLLRALRRRGVRCVAVRELVAALERGEPPERLLAFTMDDGYRDNLTTALPLLERHGAGATVFVETHVLGTRIVSWLQRYFRVVHDRGVAFFVAEYARRTHEPGLRQRLVAAAGKPGAGAEREVKRILKYEADLADRERVTREILEALGAQDADLAAAYLTWQEAEELSRRGVEVGAHGVHHEVLARLSAEGARREIEQSARSVAEHSGAPVVSFAYPYGRPWDFGADCFPALKELGFTSACAAIAGVNDARTDRLQLRRLPLSDAIPLNDILAEIDGTFALARRLFGVNL